MADQEKIQQLNEMIQVINHTQSALTERSKLAGLAGQSFEGDRKLYDIFGWNKSPDFNDYWAKYKHQGLARSIIEKPVKKTWRHTPILHELDDDGDRKEGADTVEEFRRFAKRTKFFYHCKQVDKLARIGHYAVMYIGVRGSTGNQLAQPVENTTFADIQYLDTFHEGSATVHQIQTDVQNPRYGMPEIYKIQMPDANGGTQERSVHWTRVIHVAEHKDENKYEGTPALQVVYNNLDDILKILGGSAETYWLRSNPGFFVNIDPDEFAPLDENADSDQISDIEDQISAYIHNFTRAVVGSGYDMDLLETDIADPSKSFDVQLSEIAGTTEIPKRMLIGSERGELASTQDMEEWYSHIGERQTNHAVPEILDPVIQRFMQWGMYEDTFQHQWEWPPLFEMDAKDVVEMAKNIAQAAKAFVEHLSMGEVLSVAEFRENYLQLPAEIQDSIQQNVRKWAIEHDHDIPEELFPDGQ